MGRSIICVRPVCTTREIGRRDIQLPWLTKASRAAVEARDICKKRNLPFKVVTEYKA
jgi:hypothetical protein